MSIDLNDVISLDTLAEQNLDAYAELFKLLDPEIPCSIEEGARLHVCKQAEVHRADFEILLNCGHVWAQCATAWHGTFEPIVKRGETVSCRCAPRRRFVLVRPLR